MLVLASGSPRRRQFLTDLGFQLDVQPSNADESVLQGEAAVSYALRVAHAKAAHVAALRPGEVILAADTVVSAADDILGKPEDAIDFQRIMMRLSGRTHAVTTAVVVRARDRRVYETTVCTEVTFRVLSAAEIDWYWASGEPRDKAGGYALQGRGGVFVSEIHGSHSNVIGLPLVETLALLTEAGVTPPWAHVK